MSREDSSRRVLRVWVISDGLPGHLAHTRGVLKALALLGEVSVHWIPMSLRFGGARTLLKFVLNGTRRPIPLWLVRLFVKFDSLNDEKPDVIISSGGRTMYLNAAFARQMRCQNFFTGTLRGLREDCFTATILPFESPEAKRNIAVELPISDVEPSEVKPAGEKLRRELDLQDETLWTILIGGDGAGCRYREGDWRALGRTIRRLNEENGIRWLIATSRRTTAGGERLLQEEIPDAAIADAAWYSADPRKVVQAYLGAADVAFCTEDSMSMIGESVTAGIPVYTLSPKEAHIEEGNRAIVESLERKRRIKRLSISELEKGEALADKATFEVFEASPAKILAEKLKPFFDCKT